MRLFDVLILWPSRVGRRLLLRAILEREREHELKLLSVLARNV